jgi:hypothetical protein
MPKFEIQHFTICDGWVNTWTSDGEPEYFDSFEDALEELYQFLFDTDEAHFNGYIEDRYLRRDFKIVEVVNA